MREILAQIDEAASTLLVPEFKHGYDRRLGLHLINKRNSRRRAYLMPAWMENRIVRIYGEGSGLIFEAVGSFHYLRGDRHHGRNRILVIDGYGQVRCTIAADLDGASRRAAKNRPPS